jgi:phosphoribosylanthranilate isomerase
VTRVKICGITREADALAAVELGAHALGFNFWPSSKRYIEPRRAARIIARLPPFVSVVGIFVNQPTLEVSAIGDACHLSAIQLHGDEPPEACRAFSRPVIKAIRVRDRGSLRGLTRYPVGGFLFDTPSASFGGAGQTFDWSVLKSWSSRRPAMIIAGGLTPKNVAQAIRAVRPYAVDVASGVESAPGKKDTSKMRAFLRAVAEAR